VIARARRLVQPGALAALLAIALVAASASGEPAKPPPPKKVITLGCGCFSPERGVAAAVRFGRALERARPALAGCFELARADRDDLAAELDAELRLEPNGDVAGVAIGVRAGKLSDDAIACVRGALARVPFEPPAAGGATLEVPLIVGDPAPERRPAPLPLRTTLASGPHLVLAPMRFAPAAPPREARAVASLLRAASACAASGPPAVPVVVGARLLVGEDGEALRVEAKPEAPAADAVARCLAGAVLGPPRGAVEPVELRVAVEPSGRARVIDPAAKAPAPAPPPAPR
jgi:hypothetical protein